MSEWVEKIAYLGVLPFKDVLAESADVAAKTATFPTVPHGEIWDVNVIVAQLALSGYCDIWRYPAPGYLVVNSPTGTILNFGGKLMLKEEEFLYVTSDQNVARAYIHGVKRLAIPSKLAEKHFTEIRREVDVQAAR